MTTHRKSQAVACLCCFAVLAGCSAPEEAQKSAPSSALECRVDVYENPDERNAVIATGGGLSFGASLAIALASGAMSHSLANGSEQRRLNDCYDAVGAQPSDRLQLTSTTKRHDDILMAGGSKADAQRAITAPARQGPGGGAGFGSL